MRWRFNINDKGVEGIIPLFRGIEANSGVQVQNQRLSGVGGIIPQYRYDVPRLRFTMKGSLCHKGVEDIIPLFGVSTEFPVSTSRVVVGG